VDGLAGRSKVLRRGGYVDRAAAESALARVRDGTDPETGVTVGEWLRTWVAGSARLAMSTRVSYTEHINVYINPVLGNIPLTELTIKDLNDFFTALARRRTRQRGSTLSASTVTRIHATLRAGLNAALRRGLIAWNPAREAEPPRQHRPRAVVWTEDLIAHWRATGERPPVAVWTATQTASFLAAAADDRMYAAFHLIALRGLRRGEAVGLRWCDLDLQRGLCFITHQIQRRDGEIVQGPPKTPTSVRAVALDRTTVKVLKAHRKRQEAECRACGVVPSGFVFTRVDGQPLAPEYLYRRFVKLAAEHGLPPIRLHDLRHGAASLALQAGVDLKVVSDQLGHSSIVLTADTYVSVLPELAMDAAEATARLVAEAGQRAPGSKHVTRRKPNPPDPTRHGKRLRRGARRPAPTSPSTPVKTAGRSKIGSVAAGKEVAA
jgi:integrase